MKKLFVLLLSCGMFFGAFAWNQSSLQSKSSSFDGIGGTPLSVGVGADFRVSRSAFNFGFPVELRLFSPNDKFTLRIGERFSFHRGGNPEIDYYDPYYDAYLFEPELRFTQFSTFFGVRYNVLKLDHEGTGAWFVGAGYFLNINTLGKIVMDRPSVAFINNRYVYDGGNRGFEKFDCPDIVNPISHTLQIETGLEFSFMEISLFLDIDLTDSYNRSVVKSNLYYDANGFDHTIRDTPLSSNYIGANFASFREINKAISDICFFGMAIKFFIY